MHYRRAHIPLLLLAALACAATANANRLYKWTDAQGQVHYSDQVPPEAARHGREIKSPLGVTVDRIEAAKSKEQLQAEQQAREREEARRQAEAEAVRQQTAADRTLLLTFSSSSEITRARDDRIAVIDGQINLTHGRIDTLQSKLEQTRRQAANAERTGRGNPQELYRQVGALERQITEHEAFIEARQQERQSIIDRFAADLTRYNELKAAGR